MEGCTHRLSISVQSFYISVKMSDTNSPRGIASAALAPSPKRRPRYRFLSTFRLAITCNPRGAHALTTEHMCQMLTEHCSRNSPIERTVVKSVWFGKQMTTQEHEFIVIHVEGLAAPGLESYLLLDRTISIPSSHAHSERTINPLTSSLEATTLDAFWVSSDSDMKKLLHDCHLDSYRRLERIDFQPGEPFLLHQLATLVRSISNRRPRYSLVGANCYWFVGLVWECMRRIRPDANHTDYATKQRGKFGFVRFKTSSVQADDVLEDFWREISNINSKLSGSQNVSAQRLPHRHNSLTNTPGIQLQPEAASAPEIAEPTNLAGPAQAPGDLGSISRISTGTRSILSSVAFYDCDEGTSHLESESSESQNVSALESLRCVNHKTNRHIARGRYTSRIGPRHTDIDAGAERRGLNQSRWTEYILPRQ